MDTPFIAERATLHFAFLVVYLLALIGVGAMKARKIKTQSDFSLAGRGLPTFVLVGTLLATWIGTGSIFGNAEETMRVGVDAYLLPLAGATGMVLLYFLAARIRRFEQFTIQDILEARFGTVTRVLGTITLVLAYVIIVSYQYRAGATVLEYIAPGLDATWALICVALFVIAYTALAGLFSVAYTDVANGVLMIVGIGIALPILLSKTGGLGAAIESLPPSNQEFLGQYGLIDLICVLVPPFLLIVGDANMYQRFFSARSPRDARRSAAWMFIGVLALEMAIITTAILGAALVAQGKIPAPPAGGKIIIHLAFEALPAWLGALMVGTVVAIVVSTADSFLLSPSTSLVRDVYQRFVRPDVSERETVRMGRIFVLLLGLIALGLSFTSDAFFDIALFAYTIYGVGITPALFAAFFWKGASSQGVIASMVTGVLAACAWKGLTTEGAMDWIDTRGMDSLARFFRWTVDNGFDAVIPAFTIAVIVLVVVSLMKPPSPEAARSI